MTAYHPPHTYHAKATWRMPNGGTGAVYTFTDPSPDTLGRKAANKMGLNDNVARTIFFHVAACEVDETEHLVFGATDQGHWSVEVWTEA